MRFIHTAFIRAAFLVALFTIGSVAVFAQEGEPIVIDEVIAQVNDGVITLSQLKREMEDNVRALVETDKIPEADARKKVEEKRGQIIANLIDDLLLMQKGKELGLSDTVEAEVNKYLLDIANQQGIKTMDDLYKAMRGEGIEPDTFKQKYRLTVMRAYVLQQDVDAKLYWSIPDKVLKEYFDKNPDKFKKPEEVTLSEIFLSFAGKDEAEVQKRAEQLIAELRGGADFAKMAAAHSERMDKNGELVAKKDFGKVGKFTIEDLNPEFAKAIKNVKAGGVTDPVKIDVGIEIIRVDERIAGGNTPTFSEEKVRKAILNERSADERKKYMAKLRTDSYVKVSEGYRPLVADILPVVQTSNTTANKKKDKDKEKKEKN